jgi:integrase
LIENPAALATSPRFSRAEVVPPTVQDAQRLLEAARDSDPDFGALLWVAMITGVRRGELCALRCPTSASSQASY